MNINDYPSNSHKSKREPKTTERRKPVTQNGVYRKEKTGLQKVTRDVFADDLRDVRNYILKDVILPNLKNLLFDSITKGSSRMIFGEDRTHSGRTRTGGTTYNYNSISTSNNETKKRVRTRTNYDFDDLIFDTRLDAERVLEQMCDICDQADCVSIGEMYDLAGEQTIANDFDYGWYDLRTARVERNREGFYIWLPRPESLRR